MLLALSSLAIVIVIVYGISTVIVSFAKSHKINLKGLTSPKIIKVVEPVRHVTSKVVITTLSTGEIVLNKVIKPAFHTVYYVRRSKKEEKLRKELEEMEELHRQEIEHFDAQHEFTDLMS